MQDLIGQKALDVIDTLGSATTPERILSLYGEMVHDFGFKFFLITGLPDPGGRLEQEVLLNGWPLGWFSHYTAQDYFHQDPIAHECFINTRPFTWREVRQDGGRWPKGRRILDEATEFGMINGMCVPIFGLHGLQSAVTLAGDDLDLSPKAKAAVHLVSIYAHGRAQQLLGNMVEKPARRSPKLSARERECLQWTAAGKSSWEIGRILHLSEHTVTGYIKAATTKLGSANRTQAVAEALRLGQIRF